MFTKSKEELEQYLLHALQLGRESKALVGRLITLWRKDAWRDALTRWNMTAVGRAKFNINTFCWMSGLRLDEVCARYPRRVGCARAGESGG